MPKIVLSYRRSDAELIAGRIFDRLVARYGDEAVFIDIDDIPLGMDFRKHLRDALSETDVLLAIIGPQWAGEGERRRIDDQNDWVRVELETALQRNIPVIPVLVHRATMPTAGDLPESLVELSFRQAIEIDSGRDFHPHTDRLIRSMDQLLSRNASVLTTKKAVDLAAVGAGLTAGPAVRKLTSLLSSKFRRIIILTGVLVLTIFATLALLNQMDGRMKKVEAPATSALDGTTTDANRSAADLADRQNEAARRYRNAAGRDRRTLGDLLNDPRWPSGRSINGLAQAIGRDEQTTRRLLNELGAKRITLEGDVEGWTLRQTLKPSP